MEHVKRLFDALYYQAEKFPQEKSFVDKVNGQWKAISTQEMIQQGTKLSRGLLALGVKPGDKIAIISTNNRSEWVITDFAVMQIGGIDVPIYPTITPADYKFIFNDAEVSYCFVSDKELLDKVKEIKDEVPTLKDVFSFDQIDGCTNWTELIERAEEVPEEKVKEISTEVKEDDLATLIYTSGTTGTPKGVMLSHKNIMSNAKASIERLPVNEDGNSLSFLPLCHVYERMIIYLYTITGVSVHFAESMDTIGDNLREVKPEVFTAVPRLLEKVYDKIIDKGAALSGIKKALFFWAVSLGEKYEPYGANGAFYEWKLSIARKLIFSKWQEALGGRCTAVASGSAALQPRLARIFLAAGIPVMEGYGLTESSPVIAVNCEENRGVKIGTVGRTLKGVEVKIAEDGEILAKGPNIMMGYYKRPDLTDEVIDKDGWLHTGDIGEMVDGEFLKITDRKKEIFKTSGGKYVAPQLMENKFKSSRFIEQIMVIGEGEKHPAALITSNKEFLMSWAKRKNIEFNSFEELVKNPKVIERVGEEVESLNSHFAKWEMVKKFELLPDEWSIQTEELTPTLKLKRKVIMEKYKDIVHGIYNG